MLLVVVVLVELVLVVMIAIANKNIDQLHTYIRYTVAVIPLFTHLLLTTTP